MKFDEYQKRSRETAIYPNVGSNYIYPTLGLAGESGEVSDKIKKILRDDNGSPSSDRVEDLKKELGDVLWYLSQLSTELGLSLEDIANANLDKLLSRKDRRV